MRVDLTLMISPNHEFVLTTSYRCDHEHPWQLHHAADNHRLLPGIRRAKVCADSHQPGHSCRHQTKWHVGHEHPHKAVLLCPVWSKEVRRIWLDPFKRWPPDQANNYDSSTARFSITAVFLAHVPVYSGQEFGLWLSENL